MHSPGGAASSAPSLGLGGLGGATATTASSIFSKTTSAPSITGLGGVDPKTSTAGAGVYMCYEMGVQTSIHFRYNSECVCVYV